MIKTIITLFIFSLGIGLLSCVNTDNQTAKLKPIKPLELIEEKVVTLVAEQKIVKDQIKRIDSLSKGQRHISLIPFLKDSIKNTYLVKVGEDNGTNLVTYYNFIVDANAMKIVNLDGKLNEH